MNAAHPTKPALVILAAGIGSRYGGLKQLEPVGPGGATLMDYSVFDALRAGFGRIVFVIRPEMETVFRDSIGARYAARVPVAYAFQRLDALPAGFGVPAGRTKPWGTAHAVLAAAELVHEPFAVANADDFYGRRAHAALGEFLRTPQTGLPTYAIAGYALRDTLAEAGAVSRGVCQCSPDGWLENIVETVRIERHGADGRATDEHGATRILPGETVVSMNLWGFVPSVFGELRRWFVRFLEENPGTTAREFYLPTGVQQSLAAGRARVRVLPSRDVWCGITHPQDRQRAEEIIGQLVARGEYPERLWG